jgi:hypothetical protein
MLLQELEDITSGSTHKTLVSLTCAIDAHGGVCVFVEGANTYVTPARLAQLQELSYHGHDIRGILNLLYE